MNYIVPLCIVVAVAVAQGAPADLDGIPLQSYADCFTGSGVCIGHAGTLKKYAFDSYDAPCRDCNQQDKRRIQTFLYRFKDEKPDQYKQFQSSYDPDAKYIPALIDAVSRL